MGLNADYLLNVGLTAVASIFVGFIFFKSYNEPSSEDIHESEQEPSDKQISIPEETTVAKTEEEQIAEYSLLIEESLNSLRNLLLNRKNNTVDFKKDGTIYTLELPRTLNSKTVNILLKLNSELSCKKLQINDIIRASRGSASAVNIEREMDGIYSDDYLEYLSESSGSDSSYDIPVGSEPCTNYSSQPSLIHQPMNGSQLISPFKLLNSTVDQLNRVLDNLIHVNENTELYCEFAHKYRLIDLDQFSDRKIFSQLTNENDLDFLIKTDILSECAKYSVSNTNLIDIILSFLRQFFICILKIEKSSDERFLELFDNMVSYYKDNNGSNDIAGSISSHNLSAVYIFTTFLEVYPHSYSDLNGLLPYSLQKVKSVCAYSPLYVVFKSISGSFSLFINQYTSDIKLDSLYGKIIEVFKEVGVYILYGFINEYSTSHKAFLKLYNELKRFIEDVYDSKNMNYSSMEALSSSFIAHVGNHLNVVIRHTEEMASF